MMRLLNTQDIQTSVKFRGRMVPKTETKYTYQTDDGAVLTFMADPKKAWSWMIFKDESNEDGVNNSTQIIEQFINLKFEVSHV